MTGIYPGEKCAHWGSGWLLILFAVAHSTMSAAALKPETLSAWEAYAQAVASSAQERLLPGRPFLFVDENEATAEKVRSGVPYILPMNQSPHKVAGGLIHDWAGTTFIPNTNIDAVLSALRDYRHYKEMYHPAVMDSRLLSNEGARDRFSMVLTNKSLISKTALDGEYQCSYIKLDDRRWYSISEATRIQEVANYGTPQQRTLSDDEATGLIWRLLSITRFEQRDGGVYIEMEALALSRDIPGSLRWIVTPIVRRISKDALLTSLQQTSDAVCSRKSSNVRLSASGEYSSATRVIKAPGAVSSFR